MMSCPVPLLSLLSLAQLFPVLLSPFTISLSPFLVYFQGRIHKHERCYAQVFGHFRIAVQARG